MERPPCMELRCPEAVRVDVFSYSLITAAQFLRRVFGLDPHADPHAETSGREQWKREGQRALISEQKVLKTSKNRCFYSFSTIRNQQVAGSSPATSSRNR